MWSQLVSFDVLRSLAYGSITSSYAALGDPFSTPAVSTPSTIAKYAICPRIIVFTNNTNGDMLISDDGINDKLFIPKNSFKLFDLTTNKGGVDGLWSIAAGTQFYVKYSSAATSGAVYIEALYGAD